MNGLKALTFALTTVALSAPPAWAVVDGERLFVRKGCVACHTLKGLKEADGTMGPNLSKLYKAKPPRDPEEIARWIQSPRAVKADARMPTLGLSEAEARRLASYLLSPRAPQAKASAAPAVPRPS